MKQIFWAMAAVAVFTACNNAEEAKTTNADSSTVVVEPTPVTVDTTTVKDPGNHTAENSLDYEGAYTGTVPCASCEGIETTINLNKDKTFTLNEVYKGGKEGGTFDAKGTYEVNGNIATLKFDGADADRKMAFHVGENQLFMLDANGKIVEGDLAKNYTLTKK